MKKTRAVLADAAGTGEILRLRYGGGTQPGAVRDVQVVKVLEDHMLAFCMASDAVKNFRFDRLEIVPASTPLTYDAVAAFGRTSLTPADVFPAVLPRLERPEWHTDVTPHKIAVFTKFKNGKPRRRALASLSFAVQRDRPWSVSGRVFSRAYSRSDRAVAAFLGQLGFDVHKPAPREVRDSRTPAAPRPVQHGFARLGVKVFVPQEFDETPSNAGLDGAATEPQPPAPVSRPSVLARLLAVLRFR